ncbi:hypothetical protein [Nonomuraea sp. SYSU D8015]|uniref:hypothetical protein n=1 Tax=Nonomuraea sp. SYSU D8015 TaxID=2593644 RepID=UPI001660C4BC|nr:hypothetical protein [Nonomuraea sp. SYSU D8015]
MAYPPQPQEPHPQGPWGPQAQGAPQGPGRPGYGPPPGQTAPQPGYGPPPGQTPHQPGYGQPPQGQGAPQPGPGHQAPPPAYGPPPGQGSQPPQGQGAPHSGYAQAPQGQGPSQPGYDQPSRGQGSPQPGYGQPPQGHGTPQPGYGQPPGGQGGAPYGPQNPYGQPNQYGQGNPYGPDQLPPVQYGPPPKRNNALIIGLSVGLGVLLLGGGTIGAVALLSSPAPRPSLALESHVPTVPATPPTESDPPSTPSDPPASDQADPADPDPADPTTAPTDDPPTSKRVTPNSPITHNEFDDWNFGLGGVKFKANKVGGWTYNSCDPVDGEGVLARYNCQRAIQVAYSAYGGHLKAVQIMMSFPNERAARNTATRLANLTSDAVTWRKDKAHTTYAYGKIRSGASKKYVIVTVVTADRSAKAQAEKFHGYLQADHASYFELRDLTITS